jgi:Tol biopolymer transport system component
MRLKNCAANLPGSALFPSLVATTVLVVVSVWTTAVRAQSSDDSAAPRPLWIIFSSLRDRPAFASLYLYRHDGVGEGSIVAAVPTTFERGDTHPSLTANGALCLYTSKQVGGFSPQLQLFEVHGRRVLPGPELNIQFAARTDASLSGQGSLLTFCVWDNTGQPGGWDVMLYDRQAAEFVELPGLNSVDNEREVAISGDGRFLAFVSDRPGSIGLSDIYLYQRDAKRLVTPPGLNSAHRELNPALSHDGRLLAFVSTRPGGAGGKDIYLADLQSNKVAVPTGLNSTAHEQTPAFSPDGRYLVFVSERTKGAGERDIYLYDRAVGRLLATPGLNSSAEDFDPCLGWAPP